MDLDAIRKRVARDGRWDTDDAVDAFMDRAALLEAYDALERERVAHVAHLEEGMRMLTALQTERDAQAARLAAVEAAFDQYGRHLAPCAEHLTSGRLGCDCGLTEALEGAPNG